MDLDALRALPGVDRLAAEPGVHLVGGAVRDLELGRAPRELDVLVEGDAVALARRLGGVVREHERFGTATVELEGGPVDLASARRESYPRPGALPEVELGAGVEADLRRRDLTVNAIAVRLADGAVTAAPGAEADLAARVLRVLHDASFRDDPTRLLRMARYAGRLGFAVEDHTAGLAAAAVAEGALETVTPSRLGTELRLLLDEPQPAALAALEAFGVGRALLGPSFAVDSALVERALALAPPDAHAGLVALATALAGPADLRRLGFGAREAAALEPGGLEAAVAAAARGSEPDRRWLEHERHLRLEITGDDLLAAGLSGPAVGRGLAAARAALLAGAAPDRESQLEAALACEP